jgi:hypothetical protein
MFAVDMCRMPETGGSTFVLIAGLFLLVAGVIVARWVRQSAGRLSVVVAPLVLLGGLVLAPQVTDPCVPATTTVPSATTTVPSATTTTSTTTTTTTTTTVAATTTTVGPVVYQVGDPGPSGGIIFYKDLNRAAGSQYFEVACAGWSDGTCDGNDMTDPTSVWGCNGTQITGTGGTLIGTGEQHTIEIVNGCVTSDFTAAERADALLLGGLDDWFLPSKDELNALCKWAFNDTVNAICNNFGSGSLSLTNGGFSTGKYWSSSVYDANFAWTQLFNGGWQIAFLKTNEYYVRPVRAF